MLLLAAGDKGHTEHLTPVDPLEARAVGPAPLQRLPRRHRQPHQLGQDPDLVRLRRNEGVHAKPQGKEQVHESSHNRQRVARDEPRGRTRGHTRLAKGHDAEAEFQGCDQQVYLHLLWGERAEVADVLTPEPYLFYSHVCQLVLHDLALLPVIHEVLPIVHERLRDEACGHLERIHRHCGNQLWKVKGKQSCPLGGSPVSEQMAC
mmetsp:Transcript_154436/g.374925  ORF Transcript_154436/g.374925 Transcript_154436/m.374925 type:complete len:205 (+) Transcript_154436:1790-2404(+)